MAIASTIRLQVEAELANRIPSALTPRPRSVPSVLPTGVAEVDSCLEGGLPVGAITEFTGAECSGRTSLALSFLANVTSHGGVVAWIDACDSLDPECAAAIGIDLSRMLWVRCGVSTVSLPRPDGNNFQISDRHLAAPPVKKGLHGGGFGPHPRTEVKELSNAVSTFLSSQSMAPSLAPRCSEPQRRMKPVQEAYIPATRQPEDKPVAPPPSKKPWARIEQALRVTDWLMQGGGFGAIVLDMASIAPEFTSRVPLATWFRYRATVDRTRSSLLLLTQSPSAQSSAELLLRFQSDLAYVDEATVLTGLEYHANVERKRFPTESAKIVSIRKSGQSNTTMSWRSRPIWAGER